MKIKYIECQCSSFNHSVRFTIDNDQNANGDIFISVHLNSNINIFKRIWFAIKYIFNIDSSYGHYDEVLLKTEDYKIIKELIYESEKLKNK